MASDRWRLTYDDGQQEDEYDTCPSEFEIIQTVRAAPAQWIRLYRLRDGWDPELVAEWRGLSRVVGEVRAVLAALEGRFGG